MVAIDKLRRLKFEDSRQRYPNVPESWIPRPRYSDKTANGLSHMILDWIRLNGGQAERISPEGRILDQRRQFTDSIGRVRVFGGIRRIPSSMQVGTADISATINGQSIKIEVKVGHDRQSAAQRRYQKQVEAAGGIYFIARNFEDFVRFFNKFING